MSRFHALVPAMMLGAVFGAASGARADVATACATDVKSYCSSIEKGPKLKDCMAENRTKLSDTCKLAVADRQLEIEAKEASARKGGRGLSPK